MTAVLIKNRLIMEDGSSKQPKPTLYTPRITLGVTDSLEY